MAKQKYIFNPKTLAFEVFQISTARKVGRIVLVSLSVIGMAFLFAILLFALFKSPQEKIQARELEYMKLQYDILNDRMDLYEAELADLEQRDNNVYRVIFDAEPITSVKRRMGLANVNRYANLEGYRNSEKVIAASKKLDMIASQLYYQSISYDEVFEMARNKEEMLASIPAIMPMRVNDIKYISSFFGYRPDPIYNIAKFHSGIDFSTNLNAEIYATGDGVVDIDKTQWGYGNMVTIDHGYGYKSMYAHLNRFAVKKGQKVKRGQLIGYAGTTGKSTGIHLHYELRKDDVPIDPIHFFFNDLTPEQYEQILEQSTLPTKTMD
ncbi:MAG: M23 family metallopeptidase [Bacteroidales bacterium]|nr:M23 family metallopeptidase [Bacteroidales bacterium]